jgi:arabinan endo-1,5-alpha-L-arabinosidase
VNGRAAALLCGSLAIAGCGESVRIDLFAPQPTLEMPALDAGPRVRDAGLAIDVPDAQTLTEPGDASFTTSSLVLRYDFLGDGTMLKDRVGGANARVRGGAQLDESGELSLDGYDDYVDLPNGTLASLESATVVAWLTWKGGVCWQRVFDFGHNDMGEDQQGNTVTSLFVTLATCPEGRLAGMAELPTGQFVAAANATVTPSSTVQVALSFDADSSLLTLYLDGVRVAETKAGFALAELSDDNAWLGRSQWVQDYFAKVRYDEFRVYDRALSRSEVRTLYTRGADRP